MVVTPVLHAMPHEKTRATATNSTVLSGVPRAHAGARPTPSRFSSGDGKARHCSLKVNGREGARARARASERQRGGVGGWREVGWLTSQKSPGTLGAHSPHVSLSPPAHVSGSQFWNLSPAGHVHLLALTVHVSHSPVPTILLEQKKHPISFLCTPPRGAERAGVWDARAATNSCS